MHAATVRSALALVAACSLGAVGAPSLGCASQAGRRAPPITVGTERATELLHEPCGPGAATGAGKGGASASETREVDVNGDGRADILHVFEGGREVCSLLDLNMDGKADASVYLDAEGRERRRELDYDRDGRIDEIQVLAAGRLAIKQRETNFDDKLDTWDYYEGDRLARRERDSDSDGVIDQWWEFDRPGREECAKIYVDTSGDGEPDKASAVDLCAPKEGEEEEKSAPPPPGTATPAASPSPPAAPAPGAP